MVTLGDPHSTPRTSYFDLTTFDPLWVYEAPGDILNSIVSNYHFWKRSEARDITICGSHFLPMSSTMRFLIDEIFRTRRPQPAQPISRTDFWSFITAMWMRDQNLCTQPTEGGLFCKMCDTVPTRFWNDSRTIPTRI